MKKYSPYINWIQVAGIVFCVLSALIFQLPLFGYVFLGAMIAVFVVTLHKFRTNMTLLESELEQMDALEESKDYENAAEGTQLGQRIAQLHLMRDEGRKVNPEIFSEILSARESARMNLPSAIVVLVLGLGGSFFGLSKVIGEAGNLIGGGEGGNAIADLDKIMQALFSNMSGIFGTTLMGLGLYIFLLYCQNIWSKLQMLFMARMEEFTQLHLLPGFNVEEEHPVLPALFKLTEEIQTLRADMGQNLAKSLDQTLSSVSKAFEILGANASNTLMTGQQEIQVQVSEFYQNWQNQQKEVWASQSQVFEELKKAQLEKNQAIEENLTSWAKESQSTLENWQKSTETAFVQWTEKMEQGQEAQKELLISQASAQMEASMATLETGLLSGLEKLNESVKEVPAVFASLKGETTQALNQQMEEIAKAQVAFNQELGERSLQLVEKLESVSSNVQSGVEDLLQDRLQELMIGFEKLSEVAEGQLSSSAAQMGVLQENLSSVSGSLSGLVSNLAESGDLMKVNQAELQSAMEMFSAGVDDLIQNFSQAGGDDERKVDLLDQLESALESFHERSSELLQENALKTQEILLEVLNQSHLSGENQ